MDFAAFKKKLTDAAAPLMVKAAPLVEKAKVAWFKAIDYTQKQLQNTPLVLKTVEEYKDFLTKKRAILIAYNETIPETREILMRMPIWSTQAWSDAAEIRLVEISKESEIASHLAIQTSLDMKVWYIGEETFHGTDVASIMKWWETRCYDGKCEEKQDEESNEKPTEPMSEWEKPSEIKPEAEAPSAEKPTEPAGEADPLAGK